jgi:hypothetical protein
LTGPGTDTDLDGFTEGVEPPEFFSVFLIDGSFQSGFLVKEVVSSGKSDSVSFVDVHHVWFGWGEDPEWGVVVVGSSNDVNFSPSSETSRGDLDGLVPGRVVGFGQELEARNTVKVKERSIEQEFSVSMVERRNDEGKAKSGCGTYVT